MGKSSSKISKLNPKTVKDLQKNVDVDFTKEEIEQWFKEYQTSLKTGQNKLTKAEFRDVYNSVFEGDAGDFVDHLFRFFDADNDGYVDFKEFIVGLCVSGSDKVDTKLRWAFTMYDIDGNGYITRDEMVDLLKAIFKMMDAQTRPSFSGPSVDDLVREFFDSADENHDNKISKDEFVAGVKDMPIILHLLQCDPAPGTLDPDADPVSFDTLRDGSDPTGPCSSSSTVNAQSRSSAYQIND